ncbi:NGFI-A-binding protein homolog [Copidosoma floridanum]|uniref:NGFI-A-binding protein homolog n=1 Tax=Copidosoma floridanum TaxID=29053 RepID=UPI0006C9BD64|nr:NGFI-A-binding protein homolog [Copidosoma floridanum]
MQEEASCATTAPSPQPSAATTTTSTAAAAVQTTTTATTAASNVAAVDVFPSPPRSSQSIVSAPQQQTARIIGRNANGTVVQTSVPQNEAELQLYRVMQRASLLGYYDTLLEMGGDDVQQLCDAGEEEFLEIMALVGMASKPLHVRRLQKALQEWLTNPAMFQSPVLVPPGSSASSNSPTVVAKATPTLGFPCIGGSYGPNARQQQQVSVLGSTAGGSISSATTTNKLVPSPASSQAAAAVQQLLGQFTNASSCCPLQRHKSLSPPVHHAAALNYPGGLPQAVPTELAPSPASSLAQPLSHSPSAPQAGMNYESSSCGSQGTSPSPGSNSACGTAAPPSPTLGSFHTTPVLLECQVQRLAEAAERLASTLRPLNPKPPSTGIKKKMCRNLEMVMAMPDSEPRRMEEIRKYAAIYGRFDCKRRPEKPLTLHEVSVNEAAAQICRFVPALLTRRDELFPLARRVVRDSGHYYTKNLLSSTSLRSSRENGDGDLSGGDDSSLPAGEEANKRRRLIEDDSSLAAANTGDRDGCVESNQQQAEITRIRLFNYSRAVNAVDSEAHLIQQMQQNRHRKRQRRRRISKLGRKSVSRLGSLTISPVWQSCSDNSNLVLDEVVGGLDHHSDGCYSSFDDEWDDGCGDFDTDDAAGNDTDEHPSSQIMHDQQSNVMQENDASSIVDKENDFNLKVIASCGDNIIAVANPALMNHNLPTTMTKEQSIKEEIILRDRRD